MQMNSNSLVPIKQKQKQSISWRSGHKILFHKDNRFLVLLFYFYGNDELFVGTLLPLKW